MGLSLIPESLIFLASIALGLFLVLKPGAAIEYQKRFYFKINWRMEPVDMAREVRTTRKMGVMIMVLAGAVIVYTIIFAGGKFKI